MILPAFVSAFCKAVGPRNRGPASSTATVSPCAAIRSATRAPVAPAPTISTSNVGVKSCENESPRIRAPYQNPESRARTLRATLRCAWANIMPAVSRSEPILRHAKRRVLEFSQAILRRAEGVIPHT